MVICRGSTDMILFRWLLCDVRRQQYAREAVNYIVLPPIANL
jgi:hypothetical protein